MVSFGTKIRDGGSLTRDTILSKTVNKTPGPGYYN